MGAVTLLRPNTVAVFAKASPGNAGLVAEVQAFLLTLAVIADVPGRFRFDLVQQYSAGTRYDVARNPIERAVADNFIRQPRTISVTGSVSANPLAAFGGLGVAGSLIRRDLIAVKQLRLLQAIGEPLVLVTPAEVHGSVALVSVEETHVGLNKVDVSLVFEEMVIVNPLSIAGGVDPDTLLAGAPAASNMGAQPVDPFVDPGGVV